jgi:hypothetical protein
VQGLAHGLFQVAYMDEVMASLPPTQRGDLRIVRELARGANNPGASFDQDCQCSTSMSRL